MNRFENWKYHLLSFLIALYLVWWHHSARKDSLDPEKQQRIMEIER